LGGHLWEFFFPLACVSVFGLAWARPSSRYLLAIFLPFSSARRSRWGAYQLRD